MASLALQEPSRVADDAFLTVQEVAALKRRSLRSVYEQTRRGLIPFVRLPGTTRLLFRESDLEAWAQGAPLETIDTPNGGRLVRPVDPEKTESPDSTPGSTEKPAAAGDGHGPL